MALDVTESLRTAGGAKQRVAVSATVSMTKPAPLSPTDELFVTLPEFDDTYVFGPCRWTARGSTYPLQGADVLIVFDENNVPYAVWWE